MSITSKAIRLLLLLSLAAFPAAAQVVIGGGSGSSSPSSLPTFFGGQYGLAIDDCGNAACTIPVSPPIRSVKWCYDGNSSGGTNFTSTSCAAFVTADQVGGVIEIVGAGPAGVTLHTTFTVTNGTTLILGTAITPGTLTNVKFWYGTDATTAVGNWCAAIQNGSFLPGALGVHAGYFARKWYGISAPCRIINPVGNTSFTPIGAGSPEPFNAGENANEGLSIWGTGGLSSGLVLWSGAAFNWNCGVIGAGNTGGLYYKNWNGDSMMNFGIIADQTTGFTLTGCTGQNAGLFSDNNNGHEHIQGVQVQGMRDASGGGHMKAWNVTSCFESKYTENQFYANDINAIFLGTMIRCTWEDNSFDGFFGNTNVALFPTSATQLRFSKNDIAGASTCLAGSCDGTAAANEFQIGSTYVGTANDDLIFENNRVSSFTSSNLGFFIDPAATNVRVHGSGNHFQNTGGGAATLLLDNANASANINLFGGTLECGACTNTVSNASGSTMYFYGVKRQASLTGTGVATIFEQAPSTTGWSGPGIWQGTSIVSTQGTACTNGELALSAGWQSTGSATVTAVAGTGQTCKWTITTGTTTAANPTVTDTLTNSLPTATTVCEMIVNGGTHTAIVGAGTADAFVQTTLSATAPVFTYQETPTSGGTTYLVTRRCGP